MLFQQIFGGKLRVAKIKGIVAICNHTISKPLGCALHCRIFIQI